MRHRSSPEFSMPDDTSEHLIETFQVGYGEVDNLVLVAVDVLNDQHISRDCVRHVDVSSDVRNQSIWWCKKCRTAPRDLIQNSGKETVDNSANKRSSDI